MNRFSLWSAGVAGLAALLLSGCERNDDYGFVHGQVTSGGRMVTEGQVVFFEPSSRVYQAARIRSDGTYAAKMSDGPGLLVGNYQVAVMPPVIEGPGSKLRGPTKPRDYREIPPRYRSPKTSKLTLDVVPGDNPFPIDMKP